MTIKGLAWRLLVGVELSLMALMGCSKDVCEAAYDKGASCIEQLDCNRLGPLEIEQCERNKKAMQSLNQTLFEMACDEAEAEKFVDCRLDPKTCTCP